MAVDITDVIDRQTLGFFQVRIMLLCGFVQFFDGFDSLMLSFTAPALAHAWHFKHAALGPVFAASLAGISLGTILLGPVADFIGRKKALIVAVLIFGGFTLVTALAASLQELRVLRFLAGFGLAAAIPNTVVLVNEFAPRNRRATMVTIMSIGFAVGAACGGQLAAVLLPVIGWRGMFCVGGLAPIVLAAALALYLPESVRFLTIKGKSPQRIVRILRQLDPGGSFSPDMQFTLHQSVQNTGLGLVEIFRHGRATKTVLIWLSLFISLLVLNFLNNWMPTILSDAGLPPSEAVRITTLFQFGGIFGVVGMGLLSDKYGFFTVLIVAFLVETVIISLIGWGGGSVSVLVFAVPLIGMCVIGVNNVLAALSATLYPTTIRATGTSWAWGFGHIGAVIGPVVAGILLDLHMPFQQLFYLLAIFPVCGAITVSMMALNRLYGARHDVGDIGSARL